MRRDGLGPDPQVNALTKLRHRPCPPVVGRHDLRRRSWHDLGRRFWRDLSMVVQPTGSPPADHRGRGAFSLDPRQGVEKIPLKATPRVSEITKVATMTRDTQVDLLHYLIETQRLLNAGSLDPDRVMSVVIERAQMLTNAHGGSVELADGDVMVFRAVTGMTEASEGAQVDIENSLSGQCTRLGMPLICRDTETTRGSTARHAAWSGPARLPLPRSCTAARASAC